MKRLSLRSFRKILQRWGGGGGGYFALRIMLIIAQQVMIFLMTAEATEVLVFSVYRGSR